MRIVGDFARKFIPGPASYHRMNPLLPNSSMIERLPWMARAALGCFAALLAEALTYGIVPLRAFPLLLAFPTVILSCWFLGMWGGAFCAISEAILVNSFLTKSQLRFSIGNASQSLRLAVFLTITITLGWAIRRLARQRAQLATQELQQRLMLAEAERRLAEERARASEELRDREAMLQIALQSNGMGLWIWDLEKGTIHRSDEMFRMVGREPGSFGSDPEAWLQIIHPEDVGGVLKSVERTRRTGEDYHHEYRVLWPDGSVHWVESQGKCQRDGEGRSTRLVGVMADVTHRKRAEDSMLRAEKLALAGRMAASVAHEINNPLEAVANLLYLISLTETIEGVREFAGQALEELMRASLITQQTLKFHRQVGTPKLVKLSELLETVLTLFRGRLLAAEVEVKVEAKDEVALACMPNEAQQVFGNLVSNAIDAMPRGGRLSIRFRPTCDWRDRRTPGMRATFVDSGVGMDRATVQHIFEPFFTTKTETGTGLGMWVVAQLVERHKGRVSVWSWQSASRSGTAFSVFLPLQELSSTNAAPGTEGVRIPEDAIPAR